MNNNSTSLRAPVAIAGEPTTVTLEDVLAAESHASRNAKPAPGKARLDGVVVGTLVGWDEKGQPLVDYPGSPVAAPLPARTTVTLDGGHEGREVALLFEGGDPLRPLLLGLIQNPQSVLAHAGKARDASSGEAQPPAQAEVDDERLVLRAGKELVLQCGKASITLTRAGKVLIRGAYLLSRSSGVNRIKGGSVQIN